MSHFISTFLSSELTCIPRFMDKYVGKYYSNTAGNALTWAFVLWNVLHLIFDEYLDIFLKKMQFKGHVRKRLLKSLWYTGFYGTSFLYCAATIVRNNMSLWEYRKGLPLDGGPVPPHIVLGLGLFGSFFFHSCVWDLVKTGPGPVDLSYAIITFLPLFSYITRRIELYLSLLAMISLVQFVFNFIRCLAATANPRKQQFLILFLQAALGFFTAVHVIAVPLLFIIPLVYSFLNSGVTVPLILLSITLVSWWVVEILANPLYKFVNHWIYHSTHTSKKLCPGTIVDCALFGPRDDVAFNLHIIRKEMKERQDKLILKRKPKNKGMLIQTLKCMVAIKRKLVRKRTSESSSDSESEKDKAEKESGSEEESSSEENSDLEDDEKREAKEYKEETARALMEDRADREDRGVGVAEEEYAEGNIKKKIVEETIEEQELLDDKKND